MKDPKLEERIEDCGTCGTERERCRDGMAFGLEPVFSSSPGNQRVQTQRCFFEFTSLFGEAHVMSVAWARRLCTLAEGGAVV